MFLSFHYYRKRHPIIYIKTTRGESLVVIILNIVAMSIKYFTILDSNAECYGLSRGTSFLTSFILEFKLIRVSILEVSYIIQLQRGNIILLFIFLHRSSKPRNKFCLIKIIKSSFYNPKVIFKLFFLIFRNFIIIILTVKFNSYSFKFCTSIRITIISLRRFINI